MNKNSIKFSLSTQTWSGFKLSWLKSYIKGLTKDLSIADLVHNFSMIPMNCYWRPQGCCNVRLMYYFIEVVVRVFIVYSQYIGCCRVLEGYVASRLTMSNKVIRYTCCICPIMKIQSCYLKLSQHSSSTRIYVVLVMPRSLAKCSCFAFGSALVNISARLSSVAQYCTETSLEAICSWMKW